MYANAIISHNTHILSSKYSKIVLIDVWLLDNFTLIIKTTNYTVIATVCNYRITDL